mgnify:FL=1|jgi:hypothetical protein
MKPNLIKIKEFIMDEYKIQINIEKMECIYATMVDSDGNIIDQDKFTVFDNMISVIFGINFEKLLEMSKDTKIQNANYRSSLLVNILKKEIETKDIEISILKEVNEELRTNYWNLKKNSRVFTK